MLALHVVYSRTCKKMNVHFHYFLLLRKHVASKLKLSSYITIKCILKLRLYLPCKFIGTYVSISQSVCHNGLLGPCSCMGKTRKEVTINLHCKNNCNFEINSILISLESFMSKHIRKMSRHEKFDQCCPLTIEAGGQWKLFFKNTKPKSISSQSYPILVSELQ